MEIKKRTDDLEKVFEMRWQANNYKANGMKSYRENREKHFNKMYNIKTKEERRAEMREANSVNGQVSRLENNMRSVATNELFKGRNNFR